ncbi:MAG: ABC transporter permease [Candidatus Eiseniibacteriota bacterium]
MQVPGRQTRLLLGENARLALDVIRGHRLRSALVVIGVAIGVAALMSMVAVLSGLSAVIARDLASADQVVVYVSKFDFLTGSPEDEDVQARDDIEPADARAIAAACPAVGVADYYIEPSGFSLTTASYRGRRTRPLSVIGSGEHFHLFFRAPVTEGRAFVAGDIERRRRVCMLGHGPAADLFPAVDPIGQRIRLGSQVYEVVGVYGERRSIAGSLGENYVILPYTTFRKDWKQESDFGYVMMTVAPGRTAADVERQARSLMRQRRGLRPEQEDDFAVIAADAVEELVARITGPIALVLLVISSIGLMVGGIGVMNIMLVSVTERTREIGIRLAVGATPRAILSQILTEAVVLTGSGGVGGIVLGGLVAFGLSRGLGFPARLEPLAILVAVLFSMAIGVFFGFYPARRAARVDPIESLRYE